MKTLYKPKEGPMRVVAMFSGGASGAYDLLNSPSENYQIVGAICKDANASGIKRLAAEFPIPVVVYDIHSHHKAKGQKVGGNMIERGKYDSFLESYLLPMRPDMIIGSGDMYITTWNEFYPILNVHPADLSRLGSEGKRLFTGDFAVFDAIAYGEEKTRSTVHLMNEKKDGGPIVVRSVPLAVEQNIADLVLDIGASYATQKAVARTMAKNKQRFTFDKDGIMSTDPQFRSELHEKFKVSYGDIERIATVLAYSEAHQGRMKQLCDTPSFKLALEKIAENGLRLDKNRNLYLGKEKLHENGITILGD
jgi:folate-dependent phosphoribosylglycinamide formyltransferase PurN